MIFVLFPLLRERDANKCISWQCPFSEVVCKMRKKHGNAKTKSDKSRLSELIIIAIGKQDPPGRFVQAMDSGYSRFYLVPRQRAHEKVSQRLRDIVRFRAAAGLKKKNGFKSEPLRQGNKQGTQDAANLVDFFNEDDNICDEKVNSLCVTVMQLEKEKSEGDEKKKKKPTKRKSNCAGGGETGIVSCSDEK